jgi:uncharacterized protein
LAGNIELFLDESSQYRFRMIDPEGKLLAISEGFPTRKAAVEGIYHVRECAGTALVSDNTGSIPMITPRTGTGVDSGTSGSR